MDVASRIRDLLEQRHKSQSDLARLTGLTTETINRIVRGSTKAPSGATIDKIAHALGVTSAFLRGETSPPLDADLRTLLQQSIAGIQTVLERTQPGTRVLERSNAAPVKLGRKHPIASPRGAQVNDGSVTGWRDVYEQRTEDEDVGIPGVVARKGATLVFRAVGDSMIGEAIADGDLLFVREEVERRHAHGRIVVCLVNGTPYVKRLEFAGSNVKLVSANERNPPMLFDEDVVDWQLVGVVVGTLHLL